MVDETIEEVETGYRFTIKSKRGTGTRDEDTVSATAKTESLDELREQRKILRRSVIEEMGILRSFNPDEEEKDE